MGGIIKELNLFDLGWLVGIIEGEGCFVRSVDKRRPNTINCKVQVESTDFDVIKRIQDLLGGSIIESNYPAKYRAFPSAKNSWRWSVSSKANVKEVSNIIYPYLSLRSKEQANKLQDATIYTRGIKNYNNRSE